MDDVGGQARGLGPGAGGTPTGLGPRRRRRRRWVRWVGGGAVLIVVGALGVGWAAYQKLDGNITSDRSAADELARYEKERPTALVRGAQHTARRLASERDFAADASHQLRTPLTALLMRLEEIAATDDLAVVAEESTIAIAQVERLSRVVDDLMSRTRSGVGASPAVSLDSVLASLQREWQPAFASARRSILVSGERGLGVRATPVALAQILTTLLENSLYLYGSGMGNPNIHNHVDLPIVVAGGAAGKVKGGRHIKYAEPAPLANLHITMLDAVGVRIDSFQDSTGKIETLYKSVELAG